MNVHQRIALMFVLALATATLSVSTNKAQDFQGKFTLTHQAQWDTVVLQPGSYTLTITRSVGGQLQVAVRDEAGAGAPAMISIESHNSMAPASRSALVCFREGEALIVRALKVGPEGDTIYFRMPKGARLYGQVRGGENHVLLAMGPELIQRVPVEFGAN